MTTLTANDLKRGGVSALDRAMNANSDHVVTIDVRGVPKYIVLDIDEYNAYREFELERAIKEAEADYASGNYEVLEDIDALEKKLRSL